LQARLTAKGGETPKSKQNESEDVDWAKEKLSDNITPTERLPVICSKNPTVVPYSSFHPENCLRVFPMIRAKTNGKAVASWQ
jgi:hypothetical protein